MKYRKKPHHDGLCVVCEVVGVLKQKELRTTPEKLLPILNHHIFEYAHYFKSQRKEKKLAENPSAGVMLEGNCGSDKQLIGAWSSKQQSGYTVVSGRVWGCKVDCWRYPDLVRTSQCIRTYKKIGQICCLEQSLPQSADSGQKSVTAFVKTSRSRFGRSNVPKSFELPTAHQRYFTSRTYGASSNLKGSTAALSSTTEPSLEDHNQRLRTGNSLKLESGNVRGIGFRKHSFRQHQTRSAEPMFSSLQTYAKILKLINEDMENMGREVLDLIAAHIDASAQDFAEKIAQKIPSLRAGESPRFFKEMGKACPADKQSQLEICFEPFKVPLGIISVACVNLFFKVDAEVFRRLPRIQAYLLVMNHFDVYPALISTINILRIIQSSIIRKSEGRKLSPDEAFYNDLRSVITNIAKFVFNVNGSNQAEAEQSNEQDQVARVLTQMQLHKEDKMGSFLSQFFSEQAVAQLEIERQERKQWMLEFESAGRAGSPL